VPEGMTFNESENRMKPIKTGGQMQIKAMPH
jgi:hypothetical protein